MANFTDAQGQLTVFDINSKKQFSQRPEHTCVINDLYALQNKIDANTINFFKQMVANCCPSITDDIKFIDKLVSFLNMSLPFQLPGFAANNSSRISAEDLFTKYEELFYPVLDRLVAGDVSFYNDLVSDPEKLAYGYFLARDRLLQGYLATDEFNTLCKSVIKDMTLTDDRELDEFIDASKNVKQALKKAATECETTEPINEYDVTTKAYSDAFSFLCFLLIQYFRTESGMIKQKQSWDESSDKIKEESGVDLNPANLLALGMHILPHLLANSLIKQEFKIVRLDNKSDLDFITSDVPVINIYSQKGAKPTNFKLYYPLSPTRALIFAKNGKYENVDSLDITRNDVIKYNQAIKDTAHRFIIAQSPEPFHFIK